MWSVFSILSRWDHLWRNITKLPPSDLHNLKLVTMRKDNFVSKPREDIVDSRIQWKMSCCKSLLPKRYRKENQLECIQQSIRVRFNYCLRSLSGPDDIWCVKYNCRTSPTFSLRSVSPWDCPVILVGGLPDLKRLKVWRSVISPDNFSREIIGGIVQITEQSHQDNWDCPVILFGGLPDLQRLKY